MCAYSNYRNEFLVAIVEFNATVRGLTRKKWDQIVTKQDLLHGTVMQRFNVIFILLLLCHQAVLNDSPNFLSLTSMVKIRVVPLLSLLNPVVKKPGIPVLTFIVSIAQEVTSPMFNLVHPDQQCVLSGGLPLVERFK